MRKPAVVPQCQECPVMDVGSCNRRTVRVRSMTREAQDVLSLELESLDGVPLPAWTPGAHIDFEPTPGAVAQYSLCGPGSAPMWTIAVLHRRHGKGVSRFVHERLRPGDTLRVGEPRNHFEMVDAPSYLFIAGGIGITPFLPMIEKLEALSKPWKLAYGGHRKDGMAFASLLSRDRSNVEIFASEESGRMPIARVLGAAGPQCAVYCCGPEPLIAEVEQWLQENGRRTPYVERFNPKMHSDQPRNGFSVTLARRGLTLDVPAGRSIAEVLDERNIFVPTSCREGVCGSCETRVLAGDIDHCDSLLTAQERADGKTMLICVSRAAGHSLTLDL